MWTFDSIFGYWMSDDLKQKMIERQAIFYTPQGGLADQIRVLLQSNGEMTLTDIVNQMGLSKSHISQILSKQIKDRTSSIKRRKEEKEAIYYITKESITFQLELIQDIIDWATNDIGNEAKCINLSERLKQTSQPANQKLNIAIAMRILCENKLSQQEILSHFYLTQSYLSKVLKKLVEKSEGLFTIEKKGNQNLYQVNRDIFLEAMNIWYAMTQQRLKKKLYGEDYD